MKAQELLDHYKKIHQEMLVQLEMDEIRGHHVLPKQGEWESRRTSPSQKLQTLRNKLRRFARSSRPTNGSAKEDHP